MKDEIIIPVLKVEDVISAAEQRRKYSITRDVQATEFNKAIASRLLAEKSIPVKCGKCGKEFSPGTTTAGILNCPECS